MPSESVTGEMETIKFLIFLFLFLLFFFFFFFFLFFFANWVTQPRSCAHEAIGLVTGRELAPVTSVIVFAAAVVRVSDSHQSTPTSWNRSWYPRRKDRLNPTRLTTRPPLLPT